jgi:peptide/nickel transport system substrate-binding protein
VPADPGVRTPGAPGLPFRQYVFVGWNSRRPQLADARVRRALTLGTNRDQIVEALLRGYGQVANAGVPPFHWAYHEGIADSLRYDPAERAALLDEAGWSDRIPTGSAENADGTAWRSPSSTTRETSSGRTWRRSCSPSSARSGSPSAPRWWNGRRSSTRSTPEQRDFDGVVMGWVTEFKVDDHDLFHSTKVDSPTPGPARGTPPGRSPRHPAARRGPEEALPLWHEYQYEIWSKEQPYTFLYYPQRLAGLNRRLQDVELDARGNG